MHDHQTSVKSCVTLSGIGVHSGKPVTMRFLPSEADTGIVFVNGGEKGGVWALPALASEVSATALCTVLGSTSGFHVATIEHIMAALFGLGVDNVTIEIDGNEAPILDGSAEQIVHAIDQAGVEFLDVKRRYIRIVKPVRVESGSSWAEFRPYPGTRFEIEIDFENPVIGRQRFEGDVDPAMFRRDLSRARTFGFMRDVEKLWAAGFALGSSLENTVVIGDDDRVINLGGLRYKDEFVRHKTLDALGDLALAGARFIGCFESYRGGHRLNSMALHQLLADPTAFEIVETSRRGRGRAAEMIAVNAPVYAPWTL